MNIAFLALALSSPGTHEPKLSFPAEPPSRFVPALPAVKPLAIPEAAILPIIVIRPVIVVVRPIVAVARAARAIGRGLSWLVHRRQRVHIGFRGPNR